MNCLELLGDGRYRCPNLGFVVTKEQLPLRCNLCDASHREMPPLLEQAANLAEAVVRHTMDGFKHVSQAEHAQRIEICNECPERTDNRCAQCGCFLLLKAKWASEECPLGKWGNALE